MRELFEIREETQEPSVIATARGLCGEICQALAVQCQVEEGQPSLQKASLKAIGKGRHPGTKDTVVAMTFAASQLFHQADAAPAHSGLMRRCCTPWYALAGIALVFTAALCWAFRLFARHQFGGSRGQAGWLPPKPPQQNGSTRNRWLCGTKLPDHLNATPTLTLPVRTAIHTPKATAPHFR